MTAIYRQHSSLDSNAISTLQHIAAQATELSSTPRRAGFALVNIESSDVDRYESVNRNGVNQTAISVRTGIAAVDLATSEITSRDVSEDESGDQGLMQLLDGVPTSDYGASLSSFLHLPERELYLFCFDHPQSYMRI